MPDNPVSVREHRSGRGVAWVKFDEPARRRDRFIPMAKSPVDEGDCPQNVSIVRKTLLRELKLS